jgi:hypothetical protein
VLTWTEIVTSCTMFLHTFSRSRVSYLTSSGTPVESANALPSVFDVTSTCHYHATAVNAQAHNAEARILVHLM